MRFLSIYKTVERTSPPTQEEMATMGRLIEEGMKEGWLLATEGCLPAALGARVRQSGSKVSVTDGPFTEAKEVVGGFATLKVNSKQEAIAEASCWGIIACQNPACPDRDAIARPSGILGSPAETPPNRGKERSSYRRMGSLSAPYPSASFPGIRTYLRTSLSVHQQRREVRG